MKVDKEFLIKNHFWIVLFTAAGLALICWLMVLATVPGRVNAARDGVEKVWKSGKDYKNFKNPKYVDIAKEEAKNRNDERAGGHEGLYLAQVKDARLNTWPQKMKDADAFDITDGKYATEVIIRPVKFDWKSLTNDATHIHGKLTGAGESDFVVIETIDGKKTQEKILRSGAVKVSEDEAKGDAANLEFVSLRDPVYTNRVISVTYARGKFFGQDLTTPEINSYAERYKDQLADVIAEAGPLNVLGQPVVQFRYSGGGAGSGGGGFGKGRGIGGDGAATTTRGGGRPGPFKGPGGGAPKDTGEFSDEDAISGDTWIYRPGKLPPPDNRFFTYVPKWDKKLRDISDEIWSAQENLWIQRELFKRIRLANEAVAHFTPAAKEAKVGKDQWHKFTNFYWELELMVTAEGVKAKIKNVRPRRQSVDGLNFMVRFSQKDPPQLFPPKGQAFESVPLAPGDPAYVSPAIAMPPGTKLDGVFSVDQVLTWETAAIKRIDVISIGTGTNGDPALPHRLAWMEMQPFKKKTPPAAEEAPADKSALPGKGPDLPGRKPMFGGGGGPADGQASGTGKHGVLLDRYLEVTQEMRKVPINMVLVVDPEHIAKVEKAFAESPLRFLTTQIMWQRCPESMRPPEPESATENKFGGDGRPGYGFANKPGVRPGTPYGNPQPATPETSMGGGSEQENVELTLYGVISLYERPGRPASPPPDEKK
jgi:hypothetical protein